MEFQKRKHYSQFPGRMKALPTNCRPTNVPYYALAWREMPQIPDNWALCEKFLQFCMMLHTGIRYSKTTANKVWPPGGRFAQH